MQLSLQVSGVAPVQQQTPTERPVACFYLPSTCSLSPSPTRDSTYTRLLKDTASKSVVIPCPKLSTGGYGRRLTFKRLWVQIPVLHIGWTFFHIVLLQKLYCLFEKTECERNRGREWPIFKKKERKWEKKREQGCRPVRPEWQNVTTLSWLFSATFIESPILCAEIVMTSFYRTNLKGGLTHDWQLSCLNEDS